MTTHTLRITVDKGEGTYAHADIICSDNGGPECAIGRVTNDCNDLLGDRAKYICDALDQGLSRPYATECWEADKEAEFSDGCGWWWEGDHYHPTPGEGCNYALVSFRDDASALAFATEMVFELPVKISPPYDEDEPLLVSPLTVKDVSA